MPDIDGAQVKIDPDAIDEHARSLMASWEYLARIDDYLRRVEDQIPDDPDDAGFGAFMRAKQFAVQHRQLYDTLRASLDAVMSNLDATAQGAQRMARQYRDMEGANLDTFGTREA